MNRSDSLELWRRVAAGDLERPQEDPVDLHAWMREVAARVVAADTVPDSLRPGEMLRATGLLGKVDRNAALSELLHLVEDFDRYDADGRVVADARGERMRRLVNFARRSGHVGDDVSDVELRKRIERMFAR